MRRETNRRPAASLAWCLGGAGHAGLYAKPQVDIGGDLGDPFIFEVVKAVATCRSYALVERREHCEARKACTTAMCARCSLQFWISRTTNHAESRWTITACPSFKCRRTACRQVAGEVLRSWEPLLALSLLRLQLFRRFARTRSVRIP